MNAGTHIISVVNAHGDVTMGSIKLRFFNRETIGAGARDEPSAVNHYDRWAPLHSAVR